MSVTTIMLRDVVKLTNDHIGLDDYPIFDEAYRKTLNDRIKKTYWLQEIAHETIDIFVWRLSLKMELIMPRYNRMYLAELQNTDPLEGNRHYSETSQDGRSRIWDQPPDGQWQWHQQVEGAHRGLGHSSDTACGRWGLCYEYQ